MELHSMLVIVGAEMPEYAKLPKKKVQRHSHHCQYEECTFEHWNPHELKAHFQQVHVGKKKKVLFPQFQICNFFAAYSDKIPS